MKGMKREKEKTASRQMKLTIQEEKNNPPTHRRCIRSRTVQYHSPPVSTIDEWAPGTEQNRTEQNRTGTQLSSNT